MAVEQELITQSVIIKVRDELSRDALTLTRAL